MRKYILLITFLFIAVCGCKKDSSSNPNANNNPNAITPYDQITININTLTNTDSTAEITGFVSISPETITIIRRGICLGTSTAPTIYNSDTTISGSGLGAFTSTFKNLVLGTTYYVRAYAATGDTIKYSSEFNFIMNPSVTTLPVSNITLTSVQCTGNISTTAGSSITSRGFCYDIIPNPTAGSTTTGGFVSVGSGGGTFTSNLTNLWCGTTYYLRAYVFNASGVVYGNQITFTTQPSAFTLGQFYQGGKIFFIEANGVHGEIAAVSDQGTSAWAPQGTGFLNATGNGQYNTNLLVGIFGASSYAAGMCNSLVLGGYSDWYLPSQGELLHLYANKNFVGGFNGPDYLYWSSTDYYGDPLTAYAVSFVDGTVSDEVKSVIHKVRAVRAF